MHHNIVFLAFVVEPIVYKFWVIGAHEHHCRAGASACLSSSLLAALLFPLYNIKEVYGVEFEYFSFFVVPE